MIVGDSWRQITLEKMKDKKGHSIIVGDSIVATSTSAVSGAAGGAFLGAAVFGPAGAIVGGIVGGVVGLSSGLFLTGLTKSGTWVMYQDKDDLEK